MQQKIALHNPSGNSPADGKEMPLQEHQKHPVCPLYALMGLVGGVIRVLPQQAPKIAPDHRPKFFKKTQIFYRSKHYAVKKKKILFGS